jgi:cardiolipin synthase
VRGVAGTGEWLALALHRIDDVRRWSLALTLVGVAVLSGVIVSRANRPPRPQYSVPAMSSTAPAFERAIEAYTSSPIVAGNRIDLLFNGEQIFPALVAAIRSARVTVNYAQYFFEDGPPAHDVVDALADRCRAGIPVKILLDAVGTMKMPTALREQLEQAQCRVKYFRPLGKLSLVRANHRNHRRVLVVDGRVGFTGGSGVSEKWMGDGRQPDHWRDTDVRVEGPVVEYLQGAFVENWMEATGEVLVGPEYFATWKPGAAGARAQVVKSSPAGGGDAMYRLFLLALASARRSIMLSNPYFLPDQAMRDAMERAARHGVAVKILVPGVVDHELVRQASRSGFGRMMRAGIEVYEYRSALLHAKTMVIDGAWGTVGSTNFDNRSFALNEEINLAIYDPALAQRLEQAFRDDLRHATRVDYETWKHRPVRERVFEVLSLPVRNLL